MKDQKIFFNSYIKIFQYQILFLLLNIILAITKYILFLLITCFTFLNNDFNGNSNINFLNFH